MVTHELQFQDERSKQAWLWWYHNVGLRQCEAFLQQAPRAKPVESRIVRPADSGDRNLPVVYVGNPEEVI